MLQEGEAALGGQLLRAVLRKLPGNRTYCKTHLNLHPLILVVACSSSSRRQPSLPESALAAPGGRRFDLPEFPAAMAPLLTGCPPRRSCRLPPPPPPHQAASPPHPPAYRRLRKWLQGMGLYTAGVSGVTKGASGSMIASAPQPANCRPAPQNQAGDLVRRRGGRLPADQAVASGFGVSVHVGCAPRRGLKKKGADRRAWL